MKTCKFSFMLSVFISALLLLTSCNTEDNSYKDLNYKITAKSGEVNIEIEYELWLETWGRYICDIASNYSKLPVNKISDGSLITIDFVGKAPDSIKFVALGEGYTTQISYTTDEKSNISFTADFEQNTELFYTASFEWDNGNSLRVVFRVVLE